MKSWKRRWFVLYRSSQFAEIDLKPSYLYTLAYYEDESLKSKKGDHKIESYTTLISDNKNKLQFTLKTSVVALNLKADNENNVSIWSQHLDAVIWSLQLKNKSLYAVADSSSSPLAQEPKSDPVIRYKVITT